MKEAANKARANDSNDNAQAVDQNLETIDLRVPWIAGLLAWLLPGAGHFYQKRYFKAALFAVCIWGVLIPGLWMGSYRESSEDGASSKLFFARNVYCSWRQGDKRLYFLPQACVGVVAIPAYAQARFPKDANESFWSTAFAPPRLPSETGTRPNQPSADEVVAHLNSWLDVGVLFTVVAGLLNLLAIFDAIGGPAPEPVEEEDEKKDKKSKKGKDVDKNDDAK